MFEIRDHTADLLVHVEATDLGALMAEAGVALFSIMVNRLEDVRTVDQVTFQVEGTEPEYLLVDWLSELLFTFETRHLLLREFRVTLSSEGLSATAHGEPFDASRHTLANEVKAVTYHGLSVKQVGSGWQAEFVLDI